MKLINVTMVRIYITEKSKLLKPIVKYLQEEAKVRGISVFRAIGGFGETGVHASSLVELSLNLPLAIEFFDHPETVTKILEHLNHIVKAEHIVCWPAQANESETKS